MYDILNYMSVSQIKSIKISHNNVTNHQHEHVFSNEEIFNISLLSHTENLECTYFLGILNQESRILM